MADISSYLRSPVTAREQMEFQREMSNTAHVREVADLRAAGLNPILSAHSSGASSPTGASDDISSIMEALNASIETNARAVSGMVKTQQKEMDTQVWDNFLEIVKNIPGLRTTAKVAGPAMKLLASFVESNPEVFDDIWAHHNPNAQYQYPEVREKEAAYRQGKNQELKDRIIRYFTGNSAHGSHVGTF